MRSGDREPVTTDAGAVRFGPVLPMHGVKHEAGVVTGADFRTLVGERQTANGPARRPGLSLVSQFGGSVGGSSVDAMSRVRCPGGRLPGLRPLGTRISSRDPGRSEASG